MDVLYDGNILIKPNFLSVEESELITKWFTAFNYNDLISNEYEFWHKRLIRRDETPKQNGYEKSFNEITELIDVLRIRLINLLKSFQNENWVLSEFNFIKMWNGSNPFPERRSKDLEMFYHTDNQESNGYTKEIFWGVVIYPNCDYSGGELYYPKHKFKYKATPGSIVFHTGNTKHGVLLVEDGIRFSIASTITKG
jgi:hypothetical protein